MKSVKRIMLALLTLAFAAIAVGCKKTTVKSLSELKSEQRTAISKLISSRNIQVVELSGHTLPETIDNTVYYLMPNGVYLRVIDPGKQDTRITQDETVVFVTFKGFQFSLASNPLFTFDNHSKAAIPPTEFRYTEYYSAGTIHFSLVKQVAPQINYDFLMCEGLAYPLSIAKAVNDQALSEELTAKKAHIARLGSGARVSLIIPFEVGASETYSKGYSMFIEEAEYTIK